MNFNIKALRLSEKELDELTGLSSESFTGNLCRDASIRGAMLGRIRLTLISTEFIAFFLSLILAFPLTFLLLDRTTTPDLQTTTQFLLQTIGLSVVLTLVVNFGVWLKLKPLRNVLYLMNEAEKYNNAVKAVEILEQFKKTGNVQENLVNREDAIQVLQLTRESLVSAFQTERILREHQDFMDHRYELFAHLENNLTTLMTFNVSNQANEYGQLLNEALQIGMSVHREIQKLQRH